MVLDNVRIAGLIRNRMKDLLQYNKDVMVNLDIVKSNFHRIEEMTEAKGLEASTLEPFPSGRYSYSLGRTFRDVSELKSWAIGYLSNRVVVAIDGSQIGFDRHIRPQIAMIQTGYNVILGGDEEKAGMSFQGTFPKIYGPRELAETFDEGVGLASDTVVNYWRWDHEVKTAKCLISILKGELSLCKTCDDRDGCPLTFQPPEAFREIVVLIDGTLILSFLRHIAGKAVRDIYIERLEDLLSFCEKHQVAIEGIITNSSAHEVANSLWKIITGAEDITSVERELPTDASLFSDHLETFGDRTPFMICHRKILDEYKIYGRKIGFFYLRVDSQYPTRVEIPSFVYDQGKLDDLWRTVAAECVLGRGYPYSLARAHEAAVLGGEDRNRFYTILDNIIKGYGLSVRMSSKNRRKNVQLI